MDNATIATKIAELDAAIIALSALAVSDEERFCLVCHRIEPERRRCTAHGGLLTTRQDHLSCLNALRAWYISAASLAGVQA